MPPFITMSLLIIGVLATAYTVILYTKGNKGWLRSEIGQLLLSLSSAVGALYLWSLVTRLFPSIPLGVRVIAINALFLIITATMVWRAVIITKLYRSTKGAKESENPQ